MAADIGVERSRHGRIATVTLNRPQRRNAINLRMRLELAAAFEQLAEDEALHAVVVTGAGSAFCGGGDLSELDTVTTADDARDRVAAGNAMIRALRRTPVPTIAAVNGPAAGAGCSLALACDAVLMSNAATLRASFLDVGLAPDAGASYLLPQRIGAGRALTLALLGRPVGVAAALASGLVDVVIPADQFTAELDALLDRIANLSRPALRATTRLYRADDDLDGALDAELLAQAELLFTSEHRQARDAFLTNRAAAPSGAAL